MFFKGPKLLLASTFLVFALGFLIRQMVSVQIWEPREREAQKAQCQSNLRQIGMAVMMYAQDNAEILPHAATATGQENWMQAIKEYLPTQGRLSCPTNKGSSLSYVWNDAYSAPKDFLSSPSGQPLDRLQLPAQTILLADGAGDFRLRWNLNQGTPMVFRDGELHIGSIRGRHWGIGLPNVLFCDGHVASYSVQQTFMPRTRNGKSYFAGLSIEDD